MQEFRSKVEDLVDRVHELRFQNTAGFKHYKRYFCKEAVQHPAKANLYLLAFLIETFMHGKKRAWFVVGYPKGCLPRLEADIVKIEEDEEAGQFMIHISNVVEIVL